MNAYSGFLAFLTGLLFGGSLVGLAFFVLKPDTPRKFLKCESKDLKTSIGLMIDDAERMITLEGETIGADKIKTFSDYKIFAEWAHAKGSTTVVLDRLSGKLELLEKSEHGFNDNEQDLECRHANQRF